MSELKPCPFCGSGWLYETRRNGYCDETPTMFCNSCKAVVTWEQVEEEGVNDETKAFVREHWNSRAERVTDDGWESCQHSVPATEENMAKFGWVRERTCHIVKNSRKYVLSDGRELFDDGCSICNGYVGDGDNYCSNCGARVMSE